eukprot:72859-Chlamydomonas_euryale.AAC.10
MAAFARTHGLIDMHMCTPLDGYARKHATAVNCSMCRDLSGEHRVSAESKCVHAKRGELRRIFHTHTYIHACMYATALLYACSAHMHACAHTLLPRAALGMEHT